ncbi:hypothetical protein IG631_14263 [Alternaria alternata]|nr:hypothetical protein IG631_14263 [Alternaria alternata]
MVVPTSMSVSRRPQVTEQKKDRVSIVPMMEFGLHGTSDQIVILCKDAGKDSRHTPFCIDRDSLDIFHTSRTSLQPNVSEIDIQVSFLCNIEAVPEKDPIRVR